MWVKCGERYINLEQVSTVREDGPSGCIVVVPGAPSFIVKPEHAAPLLAALHDQVEVSEDRRTRRERYTYPDYRPTNGAGRTLSGL